MKTWDRNEAYALTVTAVVGYGTALVMLGIAAYSFVSLVLAVYGSPGVSLFFAIRRF